MTARIRDRRLRVGACLSLSGKFARFGIQAARALQVWQSMDGAVELDVQDDESSRRILTAKLPQVSSRCDVVLGPYSTLLARTAGQLAEKQGRLLWNHGGSGDDVQSGHPGHVISVLTPTSRYAEPFVRYIAGEGERRPLYLIEGKGSFAKQVADGAVGTASDVGLDVIRIGHGGSLPLGLPEQWDLFVAGQFDYDIEAVNRVRELPHPPTHICAVAAGVREFGSAVRDAEGIFGVAQWFVGSGGRPELGPSETDFLTACSKHVQVGGVTPDYPAVQAVAGAVLAAHCARSAGGATRDLLWTTASALNTDTLFGTFKVDAETGTQIGHEMVLVRWTDTGPVRV